jgi:hypothetical protein
MTIRRLGSLLVALLGSFIHAAPHASHGQMRLLRPHLCDRACPRESPVFVHYHKSGNVLSRSLAQSIAHQVPPPHPGFS